MDRGEQQTKMDARSRRPRSSLVPRPLGPVIQRHAQFRVPCAGITLLGSRCWTHAVVPLAMEVVPGDALCFQISHLAVGDLDAFGVDGLV